MGSISQGLIYVDINGNQVFDSEGQDNDAVNFNEFSPDTLPGGNDLFTQWGDEFALPILGNFDPVLSDVTPVDVGSSTSPESKHTAFQGTGS